MNAWGGRYGRRTADGYGPDWACMKNSYDSYLFQRFQTMISDQTLFSYQLWAYHSNACSPLLRLPLLRTLSNRIHSTRPTQSTNTYLRPFDSTNTIHTSLRLDQILFSYKFIPHIHSFGSTHTFAWLFQPNLIFIRSHPLRLIPPIDSLRTLPPGYADSVPTWDNKMKRNKETTLKTAERIWKGNPTPPEVNFF